MPSLRPDELAQLRSAASRGDKTAHILMRLFDTARADSKEVTLARCATTAQKTLSGLSAVDGVTPVAGDVVLVKSQTDAKENGLYVAASGSWVRLKDDQGSDVVRPGMLVQIREGTTLADTQWTCTSNSTTLGTDNVVFAQMTGAIGSGAVGATELGTDSVAADEIAAGAVGLAELSSVLRGAAQALTGAGAINLTTPTTRYTSTGASQALTLADGTVVGHRKRIIHAVDGGSGVLTAGGSLHLGDSIATITFTNVRDWVELEWNGTAWDVIAYGGVTIA